jgi:uncharacterized protein
MTPIFWAFVALDAALFLILVVLGFASSGPSDGGREMSLIFFVFLPAIIVGAGVLLFTKAESSGLRLVALLIVAGPGLFIAAARLRSAVIDYQVRQNAAGSGYFSSRALKRAGVAVVRHDAATIAGLDRGIDLNTRGRHGMTLMELAVSQAFIPPSELAPGAAPIDVIRALLSHGADPNAGLEIATKLPDSTVLSLLLDAGAKPGYTDDRGTAALRWLNVMPLANFTALLDRGLDVNLIDEFGTPIIIAAAQDDRWDYVLMLMDRGADASRVARNGTRLADVVQSRVESTTDRPPEMKADIARVKARLGTGKPQSTPR